jgi:hypothetical protein
MLEAATQIAAIPAAAAASRVSQEAAEPLLGALALASTGSSLGSSSSPEKSGHQQARTTPGMTVMTMMQKKAVTTCR